MQETIKFLVNNYVTISIVATSIIGIIFFIRKGIKDGIKSVKLSNNFHEHFGDFPASKIKELYNAVARSCNTLDLRQQITTTHIKIGIYICEPETGKCIWTNNFLNELFEMDSKDMKGFGWAAAIESEDSIRVLEIWRKAIKNSDPYYATYKIKGKYSNRIKEVTTHAITALDEDGQIMCFVGYMYEVV